MSLDCPVDVVSFVKEEGTRFSHDLLESSVVTDVYDVGDALALRGADGTTLDTHFGAIDFRGADTIGAAAWDAWAGLHIK